MTDRERALLLAVAEVVKEMGCSEFLVHEASHIARLTGIEK